MNEQSFPKSLRLCSKKHIDALFANGAKVRSGPLTLMLGWSLTAKSTERFMVLVSVPKRFNKSAVVRNVMKRRLREIIRTHKPVTSALQPQYPGCLILAIIYNGRGPMQYTTLVQLFENALEKAKFKDIPDITKPDDINLA